MENYIYKSAWQEVHICIRCGEDLGGSITDTHWGKPCGNCGSVGAFCPDTVKTSKRFICTKKNIFKKDEGFWEWSGISIDGDIKSHMMKGRRISNTTVNIAAAGIASGLF